MTPNYTTRVLLAAAVTSMTLAFTPAHADRGERFYLGKMADTNRDGMVSKDEFLAAMSRMWDEKMTKMKITDNRMTMSDYEREVEMYLRGGG